ncbi:unnamed protein product [Sphagnum jensenii]|uniref:Uncharacterized protein n=1 Tax=Sphagnum jensenii TaxID=128206 RepID=A0ABP1B735_9BRYO
MLPEDLRRRNSLREQYEEKVKITDQLIALKKQQWEQESQHLEQQKAKSDVKMQQLQHEITWMQAQQSENQMKHVRELEREMDLVWCWGHGCWDGYHLPNPVGPEKNRDAGTFANRWVCILLLDCLVVALADPAFGIWSPSGVL